MSPTRGNLVRSGGIAVAGLLPSRRTRAVALAASYAAGEVVGPGGFQIWSLSGGGVVTAATSTASWTATHLAVLAGVREVPLPRWLTVPAYAAGMAALEPRLLGWVAATQARAAEHSGS